MIAVGEMVGAYRILDRIGSGAMGTVYRAEDTRLGREVALKFISDEVSSNERLSRFRREARAASAINHPNICTVYDIGEFQDHPFLVLELLKGQPLAHRISQGPLPAKQAARIAGQIADALDAAHRRAIIHRDIKPANVFLIDDGPVKVLDFGVAKLHGGAVGDEKAGVGTTEFATSAGSIVGTLGYLSPEQARGEEVDGRSDIFSVGVVLYEMLTGTRPFRGSPSEVLASILNHEPEPPSRTNGAVPDALDEIVARALEKDRALRYQSASDLRSDLERFLRGSAALKALGPRRRRRLVTIGLLAVAAGATLVVSSALWWRWREHANTGSATAAPPSIRRLTANPSELPISSAAISPDGKFVAYADAQGIHLIVRQSGATKLIASTAGAQVQEWFPDSTRLNVFSSAGPQTLSVLGDKTAWSDVPKRSPDGQWTLSVRPHLDHASKPPDLSKPIKMEFWVADARGQAHQVAAPEGAAPLTWIDTSHIAIIQFPGIANPSAKTTIQSLSVLDGHAYVLLQLDTPAQFVRTPGGRLVFAQFQRGSDTSELWEIVVDPTTGERVGPPRQLTHFGEQGIVSLSATADGKTFLLVRTHGQDDVYIGHLAARNTQLSVPTRLTLDDRDDIPYDWMPDSKHVLFVSSRTGTRNIYSQAVGSVTADNLVSTEEDQDAPRVTPDGKWILYLARAENRVRLMRSPIDGGAGQALLESAARLFQRCGLHALCILDDPGPEPGQITTYRLDPLAGRKEVLLKRKSLTDGDPAVAPDGTQLAYVVNTLLECPACSPEIPAAVRVASVSKPGTSRDIPLRLPGVPNSLEWAADGRGFFVGVIAFKTNTSQLYFVDLAGTTHLLWEQSAIGQLWGIPSPDGNYLAVHASTQESNVWSVEGL